MADIEVREMTAEDEYFVSSCSHVDESAEMDDAAARRRAWFREMAPKGFKAWVARFDGERAGMLFAMPLEVCPWGPRGKDLLAVPCLFVLPARQRRGAGRALLAAAEEDAARRHKKGLATYGYYWDFWFMPAAYFERRGFEAVARRGDAAVMWKPLAADAEPPAFLDAGCKPEPAAGKVAVDLFFNTFCLTSAVEAQRVREVAAEFGDAVLLREYDAGAPACLARWGRSRGIFVAGREIGWGYEAPREGIREAIEKALAAA
jgi:GNAT superfamily N-acetyltransferase